MRRYILMPLLLLILLSGFISVIEASDNIELKAVSLTWQQDPTSTMTIDWHYSLGPNPNEDFLFESRVSYRPIGDSEWKYFEGELMEPSLLPGRIRFRTELVHLKSNTTYEFKLSHGERIYRFKTMPKDLSEPIVFAAGGDLSQSWMREVNRVAMSYSPSFIVWGGDIAYADGVNANRWNRFYEVLTETLIDDDGLITPIIVAIGNHEVVDGGFSQHDGFEETNESRWPLNSGHLKLNRGCFYPFAQQAFMILSRCSVS